MRYLCFLLFIFTVNQIYSQQKTAIYLLHGQGSDQRLFDSVFVDTSRFKLIFLNYTIPPKHATMNSFARELAQQIDTTKPFVLIGTSMGGMLCSEMQSFLKPQKVILISSASNRKELPFRYRFQRIIPLYAIFPPFMLSFGARIMQPLVEPDRNKNKETFKKMIRSKSGIYMKRTIKMIIKWDKKQNSGSAIRIHGTKDHTIPIRNISKPDYVIERGSHMLTLTQGRRVSDLITQILSDI